MNAGPSVVRTRPSGAWATEQYRLATRIAPSARLTWCSSRLVVIVRT